MYGNRIVDRSTNPIPFIRKENMFYPDNQDTSDDLTDMFKSALGL